QCISASSAHTYRLLVFKDRSQITAPTTTGTASFASLRLQQRNGIMETLYRFVNTIFAFA
ncbi:hypothetical protein, partial [Paraburkholderia antibiotica]|uniref:hypothetical protein n=1 Tax=Paraburkholderia antibiotica TaxID=2728839 RepID=UPI00197FE8B9